MNPDPASDSIEPKVPKAKIPYEIRPILAEDTIRLRRALLWPSIPLESQLLPYDYLPTTLHFGAFLTDPDISFLPSKLHTSVDRRYLPNSSALSADNKHGETSRQWPIGHLTITMEPYPLPDRLPSDIKDLNLEGRQLHKFAVEDLLQGYGIGSALYRYAIKAIAPSSWSLSYENDQGRHRGVLLHLDSRVEQRGFYERLGMRCLDDQVFVKKGPGGLGPGKDYVRMGLVVEAPIPDTENKDATGMHQSG